MLCLATIRRSWVRRRWRCMEHHLVLRIKIIPSSLSEATNLKPGWPNPPLKVRAGPRTDPSIESTNSRWAISCFKSSQIKKSTIGDTTMSCTTQINLVKALAYKNQRRVAHVCQREPILTFHLHWTTLRLNRTKARRWTNWAQNARLFSLLA